MAERKRKRFQLSSLPPEDKQRLSKYIKQLGGVYIDCQIFAKHATHIICGQPNRSEKYLGGCVAGCWVLQKEFIEDSYKKGRWLSEEDYEWGSDMLEPGSPVQLVCLYDAPTKWRIALEKKKGAFENWSVLIYVRDSKMENAYQRLLEAGNAAVIRKNTFLKDPGSLAKTLTHIFVEKSLKHDVEPFENAGIRCWSPDYIPEYIIQLSREAATQSTIRYNNNLLNTIKIPKEGIQKKTKASLPGKENSVASSKKTVQKSGTKRRAPDCDLCLAKRQKRTVRNLLP